MAPRKPVDGKGTAARPPGRTTEPTSDDLDRSYVALTKAVAAIEPHLEALTLVGAQAVYVHAPDLADFGVAATSDADLVVDTDLLGDSPRLVDALQAAGFRRGHRDRPGIWLIE